MFRELQELGQFLMEHKEKGGLDDYLDTDKIEDYDRLLAVQFTKQDGNYSFNDVAIYDLDGLEQNVMYKWGSPRGGDWTPTSRITRIQSLSEKEDPDTKMDTITRVFELWYQKSDIDDPLVNDVQEEYESREEEIRNKIVNAYEQVKDENVVLTVQYADSDGEMSFISEFDLFRNAVKEKVAEKWAEKHGEISHSENETCSVCHEKTAVLGFAFPFAIYSVDNKKFAPNFDQSNSWQNLPVCEDCALELRVGRNFVEENNFSFYIGDSLNYYVIPSFPITGPQNDALMMSILNDASGDAEYSFLEAERFYSESNEMDYPMDLDIVFYREEQSAQQIERYVSDVSPPWMRKAEQTLRKAYSDVYQDLDVEKTDYELDSPETLKQLDGLIYRTLPNTYGDPSSFLNDALDLTEKILKGDEIESGRLIRLANDEINTRLRNNQNYRGYALRVFLFLTFLQRLDVLANDGGPMTSYQEIKTNWDQTVPKDVDEFFDDFPQTFNSPAKRGVFLEGVLAQHLIDVQSRIRNSNDAPLRKKLSGLQLTKKRAKNLLPDLYQDIDAYDRKSDFPIEYRALRTATARYFAEADNNDWDVSDEEVRYHFVLGMSLNRVFKSNDYEESEELVQEISTQQ